MLREIKNIKQYSKETTKRWFTDDYFELYLWQDAVGKVTRIELCYDRAGNERSMTWDLVSGYAHVKIDDGEGQVGNYKMSPIMVADGIFDWKRIAESFRESARNLEADLADFVYTKILGFSENGNPT
ncbi:MAG: hypothetical protein GY866_06465 [Proteobacteria bacterium]|nr:hypothetical protein [Pseudomonadota bacterium]